MLQKGMGRFLLHAIFLAWLAIAWPAAAAPVRGLIVQLTPVETPTDPAAHAAAQRERMARVASDAGLVPSSQRAIGDRLQVLHFEQPLSGEALGAALRQLRQQPEVAAVTPDVLLQRRDVQPNDPYYTLQWHLKTPLPGRPAAINLPPAWGQTTGSDVTVAVLDTGIVKSHPDLAGRFWEGPAGTGGYDFVTNRVINGVSTSGDGDGWDDDPSDPGDWVTASDSAALGCPISDSSWHGTFITGQLSALTNNGTGVAGINWSNKVLPVRVAGKCGALLSDVLAGLQWAAGFPVNGVPGNPHPARILNFSFGDSQPCDPVTQSVVSGITNAGALLVVAGGNENGALTRPADCTRVLSVGAVQQDGLKTWYSNYGPALGLVAPGGDGSNITDLTDIYSTSNDGTQGPGTNSYGYKLGTSFSTPLVSGVASLMLSVNPALTPADLITRLRAGVRPHTYQPGYPTCSNDAPSSGACNCTVDTCGPGLLDADNAVRLALAPATAPVTPAPVSGGGGGGALGWLWGLGLWGLALWAALRRGVA